MHTLYMLQQVLDVSDKQLYTLTIDYITDRSVDNQEMEKYYFKFYKVMQEFLTKGDHKSIMKKY